MANVPADPEKRQFVSIPLALTDDLLGGKDTDQNKRQHAAQVQVLKATHGLRKARRFQKSGDNFAAAALFYLCLRAWILVE